MIATLCHFEGAILAPLLFWPCLDLDNRERFPDRGSVIRYSIVTAVITVLVGLFATFDFRRWGAVDPFHRLRAAESRFFARPRICVLGCRQTIL